MNQVTSTQASRRQNKQKPTEVDTHVHGRRLLLARSVWAILIILTLSLFAREKKDRSPHNLSSAALATYVIVSYAQRDL